MIGHFMDYARGVAQNMGHQEVLTAHVLISLIDLQDEHALAVVNLLKITRDEILDVVRQMRVGVLGKHQQAGPDILPISDEMKLVVQYCMDEARLRNHLNLNSAYILFGILKNSTCSAISALVSLGSRPEAAREYLVKQ